MNGMDDWWRIRKQKAIVWFHKVMSPKMVIGSVHGSPFSERDDPS